MRKLSFITEQTAWKLSFIVEQTACSSKKEK